MHSCAAYKCISNRSEDVYTLNFNAQMDLKPCMRQALYAASHSFYDANIRNLQRSIRTQLSKYPG